MHAEHAPARSAPGPWARPPTAVCCSGGGIRSASYSLGALQALSQRDVLNDVTVLTAVSGGSYLAASHTLVTSSLDGPGPRPYAPLSPEERHLREHTRYLMPDGATTLRAVLCVVFGLAQNLSLLFAWIVAVALPIGWLSYAHGPLTGVATGHPSLDWGPWPWISVALLGVCLLLFAVSSSGVSHLHRAWFHRSTPDLCSPPAQGCSAAAEERAWATLVSCRGVQRAMWLAFLGCAVTGFVFVAAPWAIVELYAHGPRGSAPGSPTLDVTGSLGTFFTALVAIVRLVLGRVGGRPDKSGPSRKDAAKTSGADRLGVTTVTDAVPLGLRQRIQHLLLPWLGSAIAAVLLVLAWLVAEVAGATRGVEGAQVAVLAGAVGYLVLARVLVDVNRTSLHSLYRDRLASAFAVRRRHDAVQPAGQARMSQLADVGRELVVCATANITASGEVPAGTNGVSFTFTPGDSGLERPLGQRDGSTALYRRVDTADYERVVGLHDLTLFDMVAISGAAVSPMMGKMTRPAERFLLAIANVRLGVWLPHPALMPHPSHDVPQSPADAVEERMLRRLRSGSAKRLSAVLAERLRLATCAKASLWERLANELRYRTHQPNVRLLLREALGRQSLQDSWLYVTDGGHFDNLGLVEALRRDPEEVFVFDASGDRTTSWSTLGQAIALARAELDIEIEIEPTDMVKDGLVVQPFVDGTFRRAGKPGPGRKIWFCKLGVWPTAPWDVRAYSARHPSFPTDSTLQQLYDGEEFEAYRALGFAATTAMLDARDAPVVLPPGGPQPSHVPAQAYSPTP